MATARGVTTRSRSIAAITGVVTRSASAKAAASASQNNVVRPTKGTCVRSAATKCSGRRKSTAAEEGGNENKPRQKKHKGNPPVSTPTANGKGPSRRRSAKAAASNVAGARTRRAAAKAAAETIIPTAADGKSLMGASIKEEHEDTDVHGATYVSIPTPACVAPPRRAVPRVPFTTPPGFPIPTVLTPRRNPANGKAVATTIPTAANGKPPTGGSVKEEHEDIHGTYVPIATPPCVVPRAPSTTQTDLPIPPSAPGCSVSPISLGVPRATSLFPSLISTPVFSSSSSSSTPRPNLQPDGIIRSPAPHLTRYRSPAPHLTRYRSPAPHLSSHGSTTSIRLPYPSSLQSQSPSPGAPVSLHGVSTSTTGIKQETASPSTPAVNGAAPSVPDVQCGLKIKKEE